MKGFLCHIKRDVHYSYLEIFAMIKLCKINSHEYIGSWDAATAMFKVEFEYKLYYSCQTGVFNQHNAVDICLYYKNSYLRIYNLITTLNNFI